MALQLNYVCKWVKCTSPRAFHANYRIDCPNNYPTSHRRPQIDDITDFELRISDTNGQQGVACVDTGIFRAWITLANQHHLLYRLQNHEVIRGRFVSCDGFIWNNGDGACTRGLIDVLQVAIVAKL